MDDSSEHNCFPCTHAVLTCLNQHELIRKYRCDSCGAVMMCACEEAFARRFLSHQLQHGTEIETQKRVPVTLGFQKEICDSCRGLPEGAHPKAPLHGATSKIKRYYWREIWFESTQQLAAWSEGREQCGSPISDSEREEARRRIEQEVVSLIKEQHRLTPKYRFQEESQQSVLSRNEVEIVRLDGVYAPQTEGKVAILHNEERLSAEDFATCHFEDIGYSVLATESVPFQVLFGVFLFLLFEDPADPLVRPIGFPQRPEIDGKQRIISALLPTDFGTSGYAKRRAEAINEHFVSMLRGDREELLWAFDYWVEPSERLRHYLWAHRSHDVEKARTVVSVLPADVTRRILRYLIRNYWHRHCGWPDLLVYREGEFLFLEVKSSKDQLSEDQKRWIADNTDELHLPFKLVKIHKKSIELRGKRPR